MKKVHNFPPDDMEIYPYWPSFYTETPVASALLIKLLWWESKLAGDSPWDKVTICAEHNRLRRKAYITVKLIKIQSYFPASSSFCTSKAQQLNPNKLESVIPLNSEPCQTNPSCKDKKRTSESILILVVQNNDHSSNLSGARCHRSTSECFWNSM